MRAELRGGKRAVDMRLAREAKPRHTPLNAISIRRNGTENRYPAQNFRAPRRGASGLICWTAEADPIGIPNATGLFQPRDKCSRRAARSHSLGELSSVVVAPTPFPSAIVRSPRAVSPAHQSRSVRLAGRHSLRTRGASRRPSAVRTGPETTTTSEGS